MQATAIHTPVLTGRQIRKSIEGRIASYLATLQTEYFATDYPDVTLPAPGSDAYWTGPIDMEPPAEFFNAPSVGVLWAESITNTATGDIENAWSMTTEYRVVVATVAPTPALSIEVAQSYASAVIQLLSAHLLADARSAVSSSTSLGKSIPLMDVRPVGSSISAPAEFEQRTEALLASEIVISVTQKELLQ